MEEEDTEVWCRLRKMSEVVMGRVVFCSDPWGSHCWTSKTVWHERKRKNLRKSRIFFTSHWLDWNLKEILMAAKTGFYNVGWALLKRFSQILFLTKNVKKKRVNKLTLMDKFYFFYNLSTIEVFFFFFRNLLLFSLFFSVFRDIPNVPN